MMAFVLLDTGSRKEKDVHRVLGIRTYSGLTWMASAWRKITHTHTHTYLS